MIAFQLEEEFGRVVVGMVTVVLVMLPFDGGDECGNDDVVSKWGCICHR